MKKLFGTDGIRGVAGQWPLTREFVTRIGFHAGKTLSKGSKGPPRLLVVRDTRKSGPSLQQALSQGLTRAGCQVADGGVLPTPAVAVLVPRKGFCGGAVLSASHNPAKFNGIKFFGSSGMKLSDDLEAKIERQVLASEKPGDRSSGAKTFPKALEEYKKFLKNSGPRGRFLKGFHVVLDCANGAASRVAPGLFRELGAKVEVINHHPDGLNINRHCGALHPEGLARKVKRVRAHLGVAFDGDGDRAIFVDDQGAIRDGDSVLVAAARYLKGQGRLKKNLVIITVMANLGLRRAMDALGVDVVETAVGDRYVWEALQKTGGVLGGEQSGHIIFREFLPTGDGLLTALQMLTILHDSQGSFSALTSLMVRYPQVLLNVSVKEKRPFHQLNGFNGDLSSIQKGLGKNGRVLVRYSGTEPLLRIMVEAADMDLAQKHAQTLLRSVRKSGL